MDWDLSWQKQPEDNGHRGVESDYSMPSITLIHHDELPPHAAMTTAAGSSAGIPRAQLQLGHKMDQEPHAGPHYNLSAVLFMRKEDGKDFVEHKMERARAVEVDVDRGNKAGVSGAWCCLVWRLLLGTLHTCSVCLHRTAAGQKQKRIQIDLQLPETQVFPSVPPRSTGSSPPMPPCPTDLDVVSLTSASGSQLDFWIDAANKNAGRKLLVKTGKVDVRRNRLADHYSLDLYNIPVTLSIGPIPRDKAINKNAMGTSSNTKGRTGSKNLDWFSVLTSSAPHCIKSEINKTLASAAGVTFQGSTGSLSESEHPGGNRGNMDVEMIQAVIESAKEGDIASIATLFKLQASITTTSSLPAAHVEPSTSLDSIVLASGSISIEALNKADHLRDLFAQHESRAVANIRKLYGPQKGCATNPMWAKIKVTIRRRERLAVELESEFRGDKEKFFSFFTTTDAGPSRRKCKSTELVEKLRPLHLVVQAIPHCDKDLHAEQQLEEYQNNGVFSEDLWMQKWDGQNKWEIWRAIGKEKY
ncbi:hypothetical protein B0H10DRAFT_1937611 [Mycena sp. CBHHK59/15]|nr:hypothetical protein B0H10DRAFT_1937611 [Mycena sp. CBHHK59/15]